MKAVQYIAVVCVMVFFSHCDTLKNLPTNTSGALFSLNGSWQLATSSDNKALEGTIVRVVPGVADGVVRAVSNNTYCIREMDVLWRNIKNSNGLFTLENLVNACQGTTIYQPASVTVVSNDEIRLTSRTAAGAELVQTWRRTSS